MGAIFSNQLHKLISNSSDVSTPIEVYLPYIVHALLIGIILAIVSYSTGLHMLKRNSENYHKKKAQLILGSSNILYLCLGLSCVMILVNNNLARAFSIGAAISLVRFRKKLGEKSNDSNILFGIIAGMSCGLGVIGLAWIISVIYIFVSVVLFYFTKKAFREFEEL